MPLSLLALTIAYGRFMCQINKTGRMQSSSKHTVYTYTAFAPLHSEFSCLAEKTNYEKKGTYECVNTPQMR
jgi:hypothetical protein